jgi:hypothetical protein
MATSNVSCIALESSAIDIRFGHSFSGFTSTNTSM